MYVLCMFPGVSDLCVAGVVANLISMENKLSH